MKTIPSVLTIAGSDSGGGAGIQADLKTFQSLGVFGTSAITCITAQNPSGVFGIMEVDSLLLEKQISVVLEYFPIHFAKSGMLFSKDIIQVVLQIIKKNNVKLICDPVMIATSGASSTTRESLTTVAEATASFPAVDDVATTWATS
jgi:hydroxymethylpyrimidine/phosphomethylpyrimidine kinase